MVKVFINWRKGLIHENQNLVPQILTLLRKIFLHVFGNSLILGIDTLLQDDKKYSCYHVVPVNLAVGSWSPRVTSEEKKLQLIEV